MNDALLVDVVIAAMLTLVAVRWLLEQPSCIECGGRLRHRRGCPADGSKQ